MDKRRKSRYEKLREIRRRERAEHASLVSRTDLEEWNETGVRGDDIHMSATTTTTALPPSWGEPMEIDDADLTESNVVLMTSSTPAVNVVASVPIPTTQEPSSQNPVTSVMESVQSPQPSTSAAAYAHDQASTSNENNSVETKQQPTAETRYAELLDRKRILIRERSQLKVRENAIANELYLINAKIEEHIFLRDCGLGSYLDIPSELHGTNELNLHAVVPSRSTSKLADRDNQNNSNGDNDFDGGQADADQDGRDESRQDESDSDSDF